MKNILIYLKGIIDHGLLLSSLFTIFYSSIQVFCNADWTTNIDDRRSTSGAAILFGLNLISWWSKMKLVVVRSSVEAKYRSLARATTNLLWV